MQRCWLRLESLKAWLGLEDTLASKMAHSYGWKLDADYSSGFPQSKQSRSVQGRSGNVFYDLPSEITHYHFYYILFFRSKSASHSRREELVTCWREEWTYFKTTMATFKIFSLSSVFCSFIIVCLDVDFFSFILLGSYWVLISVIWLLS